MVERSSAFGAFPTVASHPFIEEKEEEQPDEGDGHVKFPSTGTFAAATAATNSNHVTAFFASGEESSWSEGIIDDNNKAAGEETDFEEVNATDDEDDIMGVRTNQSYEEGEHLPSVCTDDGSIAEGPL